MILDLILTILEYKTEGVQGLKKKGFCSNYLADADIGSTILLFLKPSNFHLPISPNIKQPILLIGAGAGLAPFRGFWQQLMIDSLKDENRTDVVQHLEKFDFTDKMYNDNSNLIAERFTGGSKRKLIYLFFGCRDKQCNLLEKETNLYSDIVHRFDAFSREKIYPNTMFLMLCNMSTD